MKNITSALLLLLVLVALAPAQETATTTATTATTTNPQYLTLAGIGINRQTSPAVSGFIGIGIRVATSLYSLTQLNLAGGEGAATTGLAYKVATRGNIGLWGLGDIGVATTTSTSATTDTSTTTTTASFGGGGMLTYDIGTKWTRLAGSQVFGKIEVAKAGSAVYPVYKFGFMYTFQGSN
jgi:hypothetical protein